MRARATISRRYLKAFSNMAHVSLIDKPSLLTFVNKPFSKVKVFLSAFSFVCAVLRAVFGEGLGMGRGEKRPSRALYEVAFLAGWR